MTGFTWLCLPGRLLPVSSSYLAVSDIMMCLLAVPFTPAAAMLQSWPFGEVMCHLVPMTLGVSVHVSTLTSIAIAVDRYCVIVHPFRPRMRTVVCLFVIAAVWLTSLSISMPLAIYQRVSRTRQCQLSRFITICINALYEDVCFCI